SFRVVLFKTFNSKEGFGYAEVMGEAQRSGVVDSIEWHDPVPFQRMSGILSECDAGLIAYNRELGVNCMPNRIFEYMALGLPSICPSYAVEIKSIIAETGCGITADTESPDDFGNAIASLAKDPVAARRMGAMGRDSFTKKYNIETELAPFVEWIQGGR